MAASNARSLAEQEPIAEWLCFAHREHSGREASLYLRALRRLPAFRWHWAIMRQPKSTTSRFAKRSNGALAARRIEPKRR